MLPVNYKDTVTASPEEKVGVPEDKNSILDSHVAGQTRVADTIEYSDPAHPCKN